MSRQPSSDEPAATIVLLTVVIVLWGITASRYFYGAGFSPVSFWGAVIASGCFCLNALGFFLGSRDSKKSSVPQ